MLGNVLAIGLLSDSALVLGGVRFQCKLKSAFTQRGVNSRCSFEIGMCFADPHRTPLTSPLDVYTRDYKRY